MIEPGMTAEERYRAEYLLAGPSITMSEVLKKVIRATYTLLPNGLTTICQLTLVNGFHVEGRSVMPNRASFNQTIANKQAYHDAINHLWELESYLLAEKQHRASLG